MAKLKEKLAELGMRAHWRLTSPLTKTDFIYQIQSDRRAKEFATLGLEPTFTGFYDRGTIWNSRSTRRFPLIIGQSPEQIKQLEHGYLAGTMHTELGNIPIEGAVDREEVHIQTMPGMIPQFPGSGVYLMRDIPNQDDVSGMLNFEGRAYPNHPHAFQGTFQSFGGIHSGLDILSKKGTFRIAASKPTLEAIPQTAEKREKRITAFQEDQEKKLLRALAGNY